MKNPLNRRFLRELKGEFGKYFVLFIFIAGMIAIVSGFVVAADSLAAAYDESFEKYNIEDGNFELYSKADDALIKKLEEKLTIYENFYIEEETAEIDSTLRIFKNREEIDKVCLMSGELPERENEIAIDRMYADNNEISVGDTLKVGNRNLTVTGFVALSDYSALFSSPADMMFDAIKFGVAVMTEEGFEKYGEQHLHYSYSWKYDNAPEDEQEAKEWSEDFLEILSQNAVVTNYIPGFSNQAIRFTGDDITGDRMMIITFLYIVVIIIAFVFAITTSNTLVHEAAVIGTLRASGYTRSELVRHYLAMPMLVTLLAAVVGNILGYTALEDFAAGMYYGSYSLPTYVTLWNANAFVLTTVIPLVIMFVINLIILIDKLMLPPLKFLRRDLKRKQKKKAFRLNTKIGIMKRFRLRIIFQNMPNYITIFFGIFFANIILLFGFAVPTLLDHYKEEITSNMICDYQYILKAPIETDTSGAEKYCAQSLKTISDKIKSEEVSILGIEENSSFLDIAFEKEEVYISDAFAKKYNIVEGDEITLQEEYGDKKYSFKVQGIYYYPAGITVFMSREQFLETFDCDSDYFNGYFSNQKITDIDDLYIATEITVDDMTKTSRQLEVSMGNMIQIFIWFGIIMFLLIIYLLSKIIIEKNSQSISMTKILGYTKYEISGLYVVTTSIVVIISLIVTIPMVSSLMEYVLVVAFSEYPGYLPYYVPLSEYIKMAALGLVGYAVLAFMQIKKVGRIPMDEALKNVE